MFSAEHQRFIEAEEVIRCITCEDEGDSYAANKLAGDFFIRYIQKVNQRHSDETIK